ncbi:MAG: GAF domain-containing protein [Rhodospirillales bacterium]|nr:GAF domain-containing protein [Rhodospirillales bacterium]
MSNDEIIDLDLDPREHRRRFWRRLIRVGIPIGIVFLIVASIVATAFFGYYSNRRDALALSHDVLAALDKRVSQQLQSYLAPAVRVLDLLHSTLPGGVFARGEGQLAENLAIGVLGNASQVALVSFADANGDFLMVKRPGDGAPEGDGAPQGGVAIKRIENRDGARRVTWERRDAEGHVLSRTEDPSDTYDPRTRSWFIDALRAANQVSWTDLYIFFTDRTPGITVSRQLATPADRPAEVAGVDISLKALSGFLAGLEIGKTGRAMIIDHEGRLVAYPDPQRMMTEENGRPVPARIDAIGDPVLAHAYDRLRIIGPGWQVMDEGGKRIIIASSSLREIVGRDWSLVFVVPEDDFVGFVAANNRTALLMSLGVVGFAVALAILLARQSWQTERLARALRRRERTWQTQRQAFADLATSVDMFDPDDRSGGERLTATVADALRARRVSLWRFDARRPVLICEDCYDRETRGHTSGRQITEADCPLLIEALRGGEVVPVADAAADPRTTDLSRVYLSPAGCRTLLAVPIQSRDRVEGAVWIEDLAETSLNDADTLSFVWSVTRMLAPRFSARAPAVVATAVIAPDDATPPALHKTPAAATVARHNVAPFAAMRTASIGGKRSERFCDRLAAHGLGGDKVASAIFADAAVMVMRFVDPVMAAVERAASGGPERSPVLNDVVCALQRIAETHEIDYLKIVSDQIVAIEGFSGDAIQHARAIAELALDIQAFCGDAFAGLARPLDLAIGVDQGTVVGSSVGFGHFAFNIWGDAVRVAQAMATTAPPGMIQVTGRAYRCLANDYAARSRGAFYVEHEGELSTYLLKGRL